jgi:hypothetical protein
MIVIGALAGIVSVLTSWIVGGRLLLLARRTRQTPELCIGLALLLTGGLWSPLVAIGRQADALSDGVRAGLVAAGALAGMAGMTCLAVFNWRVFRPTAHWAAALATVIGVTLLVALAAQTVTAGWVDFAHHERGPWLLGTWLGVGIYGWSNVEAWRQARMLARRLALGLADPVVADRMRLWALAMTAALLASSTLAACQVLGIPVGGTVVGLTLTAAVAGVASGCLWLAFLPPASYVARIRAAAQGT